MVSNLLSMLSLAQKGGMLAVGEEPVESAARAKHARVLLLASDAADNTARRCRHFSEAGNCIWLCVPFTKADMGRAVGRSAVALAAITDIGFAASFVRKLAAADPVHYDEAAERLDLKAKRAAERKAEQRAHEKNLRTGKVRHRAEAPAEKPTEEKPQPFAEKPRRPRRRPGGRPAADKDRRPAGKRPGGRESGRSAPFANSRPVKKGKGSFRRKDN